MADFTLKQGSRLPAITQRLDAPSIGSASAVAWHMRAHGGTATVTGSATIEAVLGDDAIRVRYDWGASDTTTTGKWDGEWWATVGGLTMKVPSGRYVTVEILDDAS